MKNYSLHDQPKAFAPFADRIEDVCDWRDSGVSASERQDGEPLFVFLKPGWHWMDKTHAVSGFTVAEVVRDLREVVFGEPCADCEPLLKRQEKSDSIS